MGDRGPRPDLTILLDMPPEAGLGRRTASADRLEAEPLDFHRRVRAGFLALSRAEPDRYLVIDASRQPEEISEEIKDRIREILRRDGRGDTPGRSRRSRRTWRPAR